MGWTGIFDWLPHEKNADILNREFFGSSEKKYMPLKWSGNGGHTWCLYKNMETNKVYAMLVLCSRNRGEFCYKDIELSMGPYLYDMPSSWIPMIKETYKDSEFAQEWFKRREEHLAEKKQKKYELGNILKCHNGRGDITWSTGFRIAENSDFYVMVVPHHTRKRTIKLYKIAQQDVEGKFYSTYYRLTPQTIKNLDNVEVVRRS